MSLAFVFVNVGVTVTEALEHTAGVVDESDTVKVGRTTTVIAFDTAAVHGELVTLTM